jgi:hypothetical protein
MIPVGDWVLFLFFSGFPKKSSTAIANSKIEGARVGEICVIMPRSLVGFAL